MSSKNVTIDQLRLSPLNVRTNMVDAAATTQLEASILAEGVLQSLSVHPMRGNAKVWGVFAGGRRYRSVRNLVDRGELPPSFEIPVIVHEASDAEIVARSLAENMLRRDLRSYETFAAIARENRLGHSPAVIAERHGQELTWVNRAIRLGELAKPVFDAFASGRLSEAQAKAFGATGDLELQTEAFNALSAGPDHARTPAAIRTWLRVDDREASKLLRFVGAEAYRNAGGDFERDLFSDGDDESGRVSDDPLLRSLADAKVASIREEARARTDRAELPFRQAPPQGAYGGPDWILSIAPETDGERIVLPAGDVIAVLEIDEAGEAEVTYWWADHKAMSGGTKPERSPRPLRSAAKLRQGGALGQQYDGSRQKADALIKEELGITKDGTVIVRAIRCAILRAALIQDAREGRTLGRDYLVWAQLRMMLPTTTTPVRSIDTGMRQIASGEVDPEAARAQIGAIEASRTWQRAVRELQTQPFLTERDHAAAFEEFRAAPPMMRDLAAAFVAGAAIERSIDAEGYDVPVHDAIARAAHLATDQAIRHWWQPCIAFLKLLPRSEQLAIVEPFLENVTFGSWQRMKPDELTPMVLKVVIGGEPGLRKSQSIAAAQWVHPLLRFSPRVTQPVELEPAE